MKNITIYKASAGSGKTFTLVRDFLMVLFDNPLKYRQVLAVTFTNKATAEMKGRIIEELYRLSQGEKTAHFGAIKERYTNVSDEKIRSISANLLAEILNNYSHFFISTIDRFFQYIIKSFAKELGIYGNYSIELDSVSVLQEAVEQLFIDLEKEENSSFMEWLTRFMEEQVEEGKGYSVTNDIVELGKQLFNENFKSEREELFRIISDKKQLNKIRTEIKGRVAEIEKRLKEFGDKGLRIMDHFGVTKNDFKFKSTSGVGLFEKLSRGETNAEKLLNTRVNELMESDDNWPDKKGDNISAACAARDSGLRQLLFDFVDYFALENRFLLSYKAILNNFFTLGILSDLHTAVRNYAAEHNLLLLADSNELLAGVIGRNDAPFIYEKAGNRFEHFMIDEFQDTSHLQWRNFKPLLLNSLAQGFGNMLVGDVKQAIYRWRNSDWRLLGRDIYNDFRPGTVETKNLPVNWRSAGDIVRFNNRFFELAPGVAADVLKRDIETFNDHELEMLANAYDNVSQDVAPKNEEVPGFVSFKKFAYDDDGSKESTMNEIITIIEDAQLRGFSAGDIVILTRTNVIGSNICNHILDYKNQGKALQNVVYDVISDEALVLGANDTVRFIVNLLLFETQINNPVLAAELNFYLLSKVPGIYGMHESISVVHPHVADILEGSKHLSLNERTDYIIRTLQLDKNASDRIFIETFRDFVNEFMRRNGSDSLLFAAAWSQKGTRKSVQSPRTGNAIRIMTIHKSKGLEFPVVILPFFEWTMGIDSGTSSVTWCSVHEELNLPIPVLPVKLTKSLAGSHFDEAYKNESLLTFTDNLNLMYVAFTRAERELYVMGKGGKNPANSAIGFSTSCIESPDFNYGEHNTEEGTFTCGTKSNITKVQESTAGVRTFNISQTIGLGRSIVPEIKSKAPASVSFNEVNPMQKAHVGTFLHEVFRQSETKDELLNNLKSLAYEGICTTEELLVILDQVILAINNDVRISDWFDPHKRHVREATILTPEGFEYRPDKVVCSEQNTLVIDYKFGDLEQQGYTKQIKNYVQLLQKMGYRNVSGFLWYVRLNKVVNVE